MVIQLESPPLEILAPLSDELIARLEPVVDEVMRIPTRIEPGRTNLRILYGETGIGGELERLANDLSTGYLGRPPRLGSTAFLSVVTDGELFSQEGRPTKRASYWHQEVRDTPAGSIFVPGKRLNIAHAVGTEALIGILTVDDAVQLPPGAIGRDISLQLGRAILGVDGSLVKSDDVPQGGELTIAHGVFLVSPRTVHRAPEYHPTGRIFFQMDAWE